MIIGKRSCSRALFPSLPSNSRLKDLGFTILVATSLSGYLGLTYALTSHCLSTRSSPEGVDESLCKLAKAFFVALSPICFLIIIGSTSRTLKENHDSPV